ncbi:hypothetical protein IEO21_07044 [Rhodonia placenta]|uniref:Uncharacterized protein n=1 Tax=Rhodonia placenta TaxID=104341 RepID=A0A8H7U024_9APHY|nr:hypothetical protein IEO21_07044 [Postia placenta]
MACPHCAHTEQCRNQVCKQTGHVYTTCSKPADYQQLQCDLCKKKKYLRIICPAL